MTPVLLTAELLSQSAAQAIAEAAPEAHAYYTTTLAPELIKRAADGRFSVNLNLSSPARRALLTLLVDAKFGAEITVHDGPTVHLPDVYRLHVTWSVK